MNAEEQIFEVDKRRFKMLNTPPEYDMTTRGNPVFAMTALHNLIMDHANQEIDHFEAEEDNLTVPIPTSEHSLCGTFLA